MKHTPLLYQKFKFYLKYTFVYMSFFFCFAFNSSGQKYQEIKPGNEFKFEQYSINQGLSHVGVTTILQDNTGFLWIGTYDGLNRFDGLNFDVFKNNPDIASSLINNRVHSIYEDHSGNLWIGTEEGVSLLDLKTYLFSKLKLPEQISKMKLDVRKIVNVYKDEIWILTAKNGMLRFSSEGDYILNIDLSGFQTIEKPTFDDIIKYKDNEYLICTSLGLFIYQTENNLFTTIFHDRISNATSIIRIDNQFYVGSNTGIFHLEKEKQNITFKGQLLTGLNVFSVFSDSSRNLWIGSDGNGLIYGKYIDGAYKFSHYLNKSINEKIRNAERIFCIFSDKLDNIWLGSLQEGLIRVDEQSNGFITISDRSHLNDMGLSNFVTCISDAGMGQLYIGFMGEGLLLYNTENQKFEDVPFNTQNIKDLTVANTFLDSRNILWILTWNGLYRLLPGSRTPERVRFDNNFSSSVCIQEDKFGKIWLGTRVGLFCIKLDQNLEIDEIIEIHKSKGALMNESIQSLFYDKKHDEVWIGTQHAGLFIFPILDIDQDISTTRIRNFTIENSGINGLKSNYISCIFKSASGIIYIGTEGGGISRITKKNESLNFTSYGEQHGLLNNSVKSILEDLENRLWIGTNNGLYQFNLTSGSFTRYSYRDGIQSNAFNYPCFKDEKGFLFFSGVNGFTYFQPKNIKIDLNPPQIIFDDFYLSYKKVLPGTELGKHTVLPSSLSYLDTLILKYDNNTFSIEILPLHYSNPTSNRIKYKLDNYDNSWIDADAFSNVASYSKLKPGHYVLNAIAANKDDVWTAVPEKLTIIIKPPFWKTTLAYVFYFAIFILLIYVTYKIVERIARLRNELKIEIIEKEKEADLNEAKLRFFTNISHEFKTPISLIIGPLHWLSERLEGNPHLNQKLNLIQNQANYLLNLVEQLLEFRKAEKDSLRLKCSYIDIIKFVSKIKESFEIYAEQKDITLELESLQSSVFVWFDKKKMEKIINNILSNAFKYTHPGGIISIWIKEIYIYGHKKGIQIQISDTGKGISKESIPLIFDRFYQEKENLGGCGIGLSLTKSLVDLHKGKIWVESEEGKGSTFYLEFLLGDEHLSEKEKDNSNDSLNELKLDDVLDEVSKVKELIRKPTEFSQFSSSIQKRNLLIVEDHMELRNFLGEVFQESFRVLLAENGIEALKIIENEFPIAVISDVVMPEMDGFELCKKIKTNKSFCHIPVILLTSKDSIESKVEGLEIGADSYIAKPFQMVHLMAQINNLLQNREILYEKFKNGLPVDFKEASLNSMDSEFFEKVMHIINKHLEDADFDSIQFAREMYMNRTHFYRKMKAITNLTPGEFLRNHRLTVAAELIANEKLNVSEVIYRVGIKSRSHFTRCFKEKYGMSPQDYKVSLQK